MSTKLSPIIIFTYRRVPDQLINSLLENDLSKDSDLIIFSDGNKNNNDYDEIKKVRKYLKTINGFNSIKIVESKINKGLANSIIDGVSEVINRYKKVIVLEDDLIVSSDFLEYMNNALNFYQKKELIWSISGYGPKLTCMQDYNQDIYLSPRSSSWGWATWKDRWDSINWDIKDWQEFKKDKNAIDRFNLGGNDMYKMLELQMLGKIDSWAIRWCYNQYKFNKYTVYPRKSKIINDGFSDAKGTHNSGKNDKWIVELSNEKVNFKDIDVQQEILECFQKYYNIPVVTKIGYLLKKIGGYDIVKKLYRYLK